AGLSGLNAALILESQGLDVLVVEGSPRIGGRIHTLDHVPRRPEAGGSEIGAGYARIRDMASRIDGGLELRRWMDTVHTPLILKVDGKTIPLCEGAKAGIIRLALDGRKRQQSALEDLCALCPRTLPDMNS